MSKKYYPNTNLILVGSGTSLLEKENGWKIDLFNKVLRFNRYKLKGYEKYTGTKTNFWWTVNPYVDEKIEDYDIIFTHSFKTPDSCTSYPTFKNKNKIISIHPDFSNSLVNLIPFPSSGILAIHYLLKFYDKITLTGFDWWERDQQHYYDNQIRGTHTPKIEKKVIDNLKIQGKLEFLD